VERFRKQIKRMVDMIGETDVDKIIEVVKGLEKDQAYEEGYYLVKQIEEVKKETIKAEKKDVAVESEKREASEIEIGFI